MLQSHLPDASHFISPMNAGALLYCALTFMAANRFAGGGLGWQANFWGRPIYYAAPFIGLMLWPIFGAWEALALAVGFLLWRLPSQADTLDMGRWNKSTIRDFLVIWVKGFAGATAWIWVGGIAAFFTAMTSLGFGVACAYLIAMLVCKHWFPQKDHVPYAEYLAGLWWAVVAYTFYGA